MSNFIKLRNALRKQFESMSTGHVYLSAVSKDELWNMYITGMDEDFNPHFRERTEHDCNCCKSFIRNSGRMLALVDGELKSIWDIKIDIPEYQALADKLSRANKEAGITSIYMNEVKEVGRDHNIEELENGESIKWNHFHHVLPTHLVDAERADGRKGDASSYRKLVKRSITELDPEQVKLVIELIDQDSIERGKQYRRTVETIDRLQDAYYAIEDPAMREVFLWEESLKLGDVKLRNSAIGVLLVDLSEGELGLEKSVEKYERDIVGDGYMRTTALATPKMKQAAVDKTVELGIEPSLHRCHAKKEDIDVANVIYADREVQEHMANSIFDAVPTTRKATVPNLEKVEEMSIEKFIKDVVPKAESIELYLQNSQEANLMTLIAPVHKHAPNIFKWDNNYSWAFKDDLATSSTRERVKSMGGRVENVDVRFSPEWNNEIKNLDDLDAHCQEPDGYEIYFNNRGVVSNCGGMLDVDIQHPQGVAVENITYETKSKMKKGIYKFMINNFAHRGGRGWKAELEINGQIYTYHYDKAMRTNEKIVVAEVEFDGKELRLIGGMDCEKQVKTLWGLDSQNFHKVDMVMKSPNFWNDNAVGNEHLFFILKDCKNPDSVRGFYTEFLMSELLPERKVFELLGSVTKAPYSEEQLSGVGFSTTHKGELILRVKGSFSRVIKIKL